MPSIYTHNKFSKDVYEKLNNNLKNKLDKTYYEIFSQSFDNLYYYNFLSLKNGKHIRDLGHFAHNSNTNLYFKNIIEYIINNNLHNNKEVISYLYGSINHYICDSNIHPYVFYKTGNVIRKNKNTFKYKGMHARLEIMLDAYFYNKDTKKNFNYYNIVKDIIPKLEFSKELINTMNYAFQETFNKKNMGIIYNKSYLQERYTMRILMMDPIGFKKILYSIYDFFTPKKDTKYRYYSFHTRKIDNNILNLKHDAWCYPVNQDIFYNKSILDLYRDTVNKAFNILKKMDMVLNNKYKLDLFLKELGNNSYVTGLDCNEKKTMKYFEY